jgi:hypothetical protein
VTDQDILRAEDAVKATRVPSPQTGPGSQNVIVNVVNQKKRVHHGFHLFMTIITAGLWLPVWLIVAISA